MDRVPIVNPRIVDSFGNTITQIKTDQQIQISASISNQNIFNQPFTYLVQIQDSFNTVHSLSWITGNLEKGQSFSPAVSWVPENPGKYTATIFVWDSLTNPVAFSPTVQIEINVN